MGKVLGKQTIMFEKPINIISYYSVAGQKEGFGNFKEYFNKILKDDFVGEKTFEHAEQKILEESIVGACSEAKLKVSDLDILFGGDLLNQIISSNFTANRLDATFLGLYGACSTMGESLIVGANFIESGCANLVACATSSHFSSAERQYRYPLELGNQRPPTSQWTITGAGCTILSSKGKGPKIVSATIGKVTDYGIKDVNNMGAAMAPAAMRTLVAHFKNTKTKPNDYDLIVTGDLGKLGSEILMDLMEKEGYKLGTNYADCGQMMFSINQKTYQGGSGAGCSALVLNSYILSKLKSKKINKVLFAPTGALLSTTSTQQGDSIPCICHAVQIEKGE